jgi:hypothetical protein
VAGKYLVEGDLASDVLAGFAESVVVAFCGSSTTVGVAVFTVEPAWASSCWGHRTLRTLRFTLAFYLSGVVKACENVEVVC